jgi:hypothetical protein
MSKITRFIESIPEQTPEIMIECMGLEVRNRDTIQQSTVELAARGIIGMISFAKFGRLPYRLKLPQEEYALRLLPQESMEHASVVCCFEGFPYARTISPSIQNFIAGALAFSGVRTYILTDEMKDEIISFADIWGDSSNTRKILDVYSLENYDEATLLKACERTEYFEVFGELLDKDKAMLIEKATHLMEKYPGNNVLNSTLADRHIRNNSGINVSDMVWKMIKEDIVCDSYIIQRTQASWIPMKNAIRWMIKSGNELHAKDHPQLFEAAKTWATSDSYNGEIHLSFAKEIADVSPKLAYTQASNAAAIYFSQEKKPPIEAISFAKELATKNHWIELSEVLGWALERIMI